MSSPGPLKLDPREHRPKEVHHPGRLPGPQRARWGRKGQNDSSEPKRERESGRGDRGREPSASHRVAGGNRRAKKKTHP